MPTKYISKSDYISLTEYKDWLNERDRSDAEKRRKLHNKVVYSSGKKWQAGREIKSWSCFVPNRQAWAVISKSAGIDVPDEPSGEGIDELSIQLSGGLYTSTKGMPTGISLELKPRGSAGYAPNFFIIIDDPSLRFDIGRKAIQSRQQGMLKEIAYENFRDYINFVRKYLAGSFDDKIEGWDRQAAFDEISILPDLQSSKTTFIKRPNTQEATVCAIFYELLGKGHIIDITPLISGYNNRYDLYAKVKGKNSVIEFKYDLSGVFKDFNDERKMFDEIDCIVCWEITERDRREATRRGLNIEEIGKSSFSTSSKFPHATAEIWIDSVKPIYIIEIKGLAA